MYGSAAVGLSGDSAQHYGFLSGCCPDGSPGTYTWQESSIARSQGWHLFELYLENNTCTVSIDGEIVAAGPSEGRSDEKEEVWLVAKRGDVGHWAAIELLHTPPSCAFRGAQGHALGDRNPWKLESIDRGRWQIASSNGKPVVHGEAEIVSSQPAELSVPELDIPPPPAMPATMGAFTIQCWSLPGESDLARIERVTAIFVEQLIAAGIVIPENFERVGRCGARTDPQPCYIYRFGSRRLHISIREAEGGKLCLVVRCGGGFLDFAEFARKNGSLEQVKLLKLQRQCNQGKQLVQVASVYSKGERRLRQVNPDKAYRHPTSCQSMSNHAL